MSKETTPCTWMTILNFLLTENPGSFIVNYRISVEGTLPISSTHWILAILVTPTGYTFITPAIT